jgi:hypothetical protein
LAKTPAAPASADHYAIYRRSLIERHVTQAGRLLQGIWLVEKDRAAGPGFLDQWARWSEERAEADGQLIDYFAYPALVATGDQKTPFVLPGGGDNPLLYGGLAIATFAAEAQLGASPHSFGYATQMLNYVLSCEHIGPNGVRSGYLLRRRNYWWPTGHASTDELSGLLLGLLFYVRAGRALGHAAETQLAIELLNRIGAYLQNGQYVYKPPAGVNVAVEIDKVQCWPFQFPFSRVFKECTGNSYRMNATIPDEWNDTWNGPLATFLAIANLDPNYQPKDLFKSVLKHFPTVYTASAGENFFNLTMVAYCVLMILVPDVVEDEVKEEIADAADQFFFELSRYPESPAHENAFFGVVAKLCRDTRDSSLMDNVRGFVSSFPIVGAVYQLTRVINNGLCRAAAMLAEGCRNTVSSWKYECSEWGTEEKEECAEEEDRGYSDCARWETQERSECSDWGMFSFICIAWVTVRTTFCDAWVWVSNWVCVAWVTVWETVCLVGAWIVSGVCTALTWGVQRATCVRDHSWEEEIEDAVAILLDPGGRWFHDAPLGHAQDAEQFPFVVAPLVHATPEGALFYGGDTFTWVHSDASGHCFTYKRAWDVAKPHRDYGPRGTMTLSNLHVAGDYVPNLRNGLRLESSGLDLLFPRILLAYLGYAAVPAIGAAQWAFLPLRGPVPSDPVYP